MAFEYLQRGRLCNLLGQSVIVHYRSHSEKVFPYIQGNVLCLVLPIVSDPVTGEDQTVSGSTFFTPSLPIY